MADKKNGASSSLKSANDYTGRRILVEREVVEVEEINGLCLEVVDCGILVEYVKRGNKVTEFFPYAHVKRIRHLESIKAKRLVEETHVQ